MEAVGSRGLISATTQHLVQGTAHSKADKTETDLGWQGSSCGLDAWRVPTRTGAAAESQLGDWVHPPLWALGTRAGALALPCTTQNSAHGKQEAQGSWLQGATVAPSQGHAGSSGVLPDPGPSRAQCRDWSSRGPEEGGAGAASRGSPSLLVGMYVSLGRAIIQGAELSPKHMGCLPGYGLAALAS